MPLLLSDQHVIPLRIGLATREPNSAEPPNRYLEQARLALIDAEIRRDSWRFAQESP
jgi:hypothetical protein